jgi:hypothetical protein
VQPKEGFLALIQLVRCPIDRRDFGLPPYKLLEQELASVKDQPKTAADTSPKGSSLKQVATPTASEIMDQSKNQQSIQNDKDDIEQRKVSMEQLKSTMETQIVQINDRISQTESTTTERLVAK